LNKTYGLIDISVLLLTGCSAGEAATSASSADAPSARGSVDAKYVPDVTGKTPGQADNILGLAGVD
jgi:PBP1b-binding outer membrane lipoprotein LpoB